MESAIKREMLRHFLAALAYRTQKALRGAPQDFAEFAAGNEVRTPHELICHMRSVLGYARTFFIGGNYPHPVPGNFDADVQAFHEMLEDLSQRPAAGDELENITEEQLLRGPFSDAMTHAGQLAMLRRLHREPVASENFIFANITPSNLTHNQPEPAKPDTDWSDPGFGDAKEQIGKVDIRVIPTCHFSVWNLCGAVQLN
ncbi:MAG: hypothetical protein ABL959_00875 [Pyrinomonadaceae bacterium]